MVAQQVCSRGEVRRPQLHLLIAMLIGVFGLYASWHAYRVLVDLRVFDPTPRWTMYLTRSLAIEIPFCESCGAWASEVRRFELSDRAIVEAATTELTPVVVNLAIDEATEKALAP